MDNNFKIDDNEKFVESDKVKKQLFSEIEIIRDSMLMVNMFMGEPFKMATTLLQELQNTNTDTKS